MCGQFRPDHFRGVMSVVAKLFSIVKPDAAFFGQKDYQQYLIIKRMTTDLNLDVDVRVLPTVREEDGLAMSSRNIYLGPKQRKDAVCLHRALQRAEELIGAGESSAVKVASEMKRVIHRVKGARVDYIAIVNSDTLEPVKEIKGKSLIAAAVRIGKARLIDNILV
jgi:pantoate--beta-alanine ligase